MAKIIARQPFALSSTNIAASTEDEYDYTGGTTYTEGDIVKVSYESNGSTARFPVREYKATGTSSGYPPSAPVTEWVEIGAQNAHKMFDGYNNSRTIGASTTIEVNLAIANRIQYICLLGVANASQIEVIQKKTDGTVFSTHTVDLSTSYTPVGYYSWLFGLLGVDRFYRRSAIIELPGALTTPTLEITITGNSGEVACGQCFPGVGFDLGETQWEAEPELKDYSTFDKNELGTTRYVPRQTVRNVRGTLWIETTDYDRLYTIFESMMNDLALYDFNNESAGDYSFDALRVYGKLESMTGGIQYGYTALNMKITGLE